MVKKDVLLRRANIKKNIIIWTWIPPLTTSSKKAWVYVVWGTACGQNDGLLFYTWTILRVITLLHTSNCEGFQWLHQKGMSPSCVRQCLFFNFAIVNMKGPNIDMVNTFKNINLVVNWLWPFYSIHQSVSTSDRSIYHTQAGVEPTEAEIRLSIQTPKSKVKLIGNFLLLRLRFTLCYKFHIKTFF